jgi:predicted enzyme related to lactoylglutathione lyase
MSPPIGGRQPVQLIAESQGATVTTRTNAPVGSPCWADLWTSDVEGSRSFYAELFGWEADAPDPEFGGYFTFRRNGVQIAGGMGDMGETIPADNTWKVYLDTADITKTVEAAEAQGARIASPPSPVGDLGIQAVLDDPTGARLGVWQAGSFPGFTVLDEHGTPSWFELFTRDHGTAVDFYVSVFGLEASVVGDTAEFRYTTMREPGGGEDRAGIMDAAAFLPEGVAAHWSIYWEVEDVDAAVATVGSLGGSVVDGPQDSPYGRMATVTDPAGAQFKLRTGP